MDHTQSDYRSCDQNFNDQNEPTKHKSGQLKKPNLSIDLPSQPNANQIANQIANQMANQTVSNQSNQPMIHPTNGQLAGQPLGQHSPFLCPTNRFPQSYSPTVILQTNLLSSANAAFSNGHHPTSSLTPKLPLTPFSLNGFHDELRPRESPFGCKEAMANPFAEVFKQAAINRLSGFESYEVGERNTHDDKTESLNTPSIDLKSFEPRKYTNGCKLDLLITADHFSTLCDNLNSQTVAEHSDGCSGHSTTAGHTIESADEPQNLKVDISRMDTSLLDTPSTSSTNPSDTPTTKPKPRNKPILPILPKPDPTPNQVPQNQPNYSYVLKMPDGSSMPIPLQSTESQANGVQPTSMNLMSNSFFSSNYSSYAPVSTAEPSFPSPMSPPILNESTNSKKVKKRSQPAKRTKSEVEVPDDVQTTTLKSIRNVLVESSALSHLDQQLNQKLEQQLNQKTGQPSPLPGPPAQPESIHSQSSQCSTSSSMFSRSNREPPPNENSSHSIVDDTPTGSSTATIKSKPGRKAKNQPKEDLKEKKARSLERNRNAAQRCRTKRKIWMNTLDEKVDELEKQNQNLRVNCDKMANQVKVLRKILSMEKIDGSLLEHYKHVLFENDSTDQGSNSHNQLDSAASDKNTATFDSFASQAMHSSISREVTNQSQPVSQIASQMASQMASQTTSQTTSQMNSPMVGATFDSGNNRETMQNEMMMRMGPNYNSFDVLLAAAKNSS